MCRKDERYEAFRLSSGLDIDQMMKDLMRAERIPVNKLEKQRTELGWKMDAYREINVKMQALHSSILIH